MTEMLISASLPAKRVKTDSHSASLKFLATAAVTPVPAADSNFDRFLAAPAPLGVDIDALGWWQHMLPHSQQLRA